MARSVQAATCFAYSALFTTIMTVWVMSLAVARDQDCAGDCGRDRGVQMGLEVSWLRRNRRKVEGQAGDGSRGR